MTKKCSDCGGTLESGFVPDMSYGAAFQSSWHAGEPDEKSMLDYLKFGQGIKYDRTQLILIEAWRCCDCGLLKFYANN
jgi:hypothetical protein